MIQKIRIWSGYHIVLVGLVLQALKTQYRMTRK
jgi:hypothetical protein